jgi:hypothetical protein
MIQQITAAAAETMTLGGDLTVNRLGYGAMRITGEGIWGPPKGLCGEKLGCGKWAVEGVFSLVLLLRRRSEQLADELGLPGSIRFPYPLGSFLPNHVCGFDPLYG